MSTTLHNLEAVEANAERQRLCLRMFEHYKIIIPALAALGMDGAGASTGELHQAEAALAFAAAIMERFGGDRPTRH